MRRRKLKKKLTMKVIWSPTSTNEWSLMTGYRCRSGRRPNVLFHIWSSGEVAFLVKSTVQYNDELNDFLATKISKTYYQWLNFGR